MKLIVQIPCFNEEKTLPEMVRDIPRVLACSGTQIEHHLSYSYTIETVIQAGKKHLATTLIPKLPTRRRAPRACSKHPFIYRAASLTMLRMYAMYQSLRVCFYVAASLCRCSGPCRSCDS